MLNIHNVNPDESIFASVAWNLWTEGRLGTDLLAGALPGIEHHVYWTMPLHHLVLAPWLGLWGLSLLSVRALSMALAAAVLGLLCWESRLHRNRACWMASAVLICDTSFDYAGTVGRMDMLAIALTTLAIVLIGKPDRKYWHVVAAGAISAGAALTHPLGACAGMAVLATVLIEDRKFAWHFLVGALPPILLWALYVLLDLETFAAQMSLQLARKSNNTNSPIDNGRRFLQLYGFWWPIAAICLWPAVLLLGEVAYPAYVAPAAAVGLASLLARIRFGPVLVGLLLVIRLGPVVADPPPLGGIDPGYDAYCARVEKYLGRDHTVLLGLLPDPWFGLQHRADLDFRLAPPVPLNHYLLHSYVYQAAVTVIGGYNPPGFYGVMLNWETISIRGQKLWVLENDGRMVDYDEVLAERRDEQPSR